MNFKEYTQLAIRTKNYDLTQEELIMNAQFGLIGETGEVIDLMKKVFFHSHKLNLKELKKELGDITWYLALASDTLNLNTTYQECKFLNASKAPTDYLNLSKTVNHLVKTLSSKEKIKESYLLNSYIKQCLIQINYICFVNGFTLSEILKKNIEKLMERYPEGFSSINSINRG